MFTAVRVLSWRRHIFTIVKNRQFGKVVEAFHSGCDKGEADHHRLVPVYVCYLDAGM
jgi:hypothetical protein